MDIKPKMLIHIIVSTLGGVLGIAALFTQEIAAKEAQDEMDKHLEEKYILIPRKKKGEQ